MKRERNNKNKIGIFIFQIEREIKKLQLKACLYICFCYSLGANLEQRKKTIALIHLKLSVAFLLFYEIFYIKSN